MSANKKEPAKPAKDPTEIEDAEDEMIVVQETGINGKRDTEGAAIIPTLKGLKVVVGAAVALIGTTWAVLEFFVVRPAAREQDELEVQLSRLSAEHVGLGAQLDELRERYQAITSQLEPQIILSSPARYAEEIGASVTLEWVDTDDGVPDQGYVLELSVSGQDDSGAWSFSKTMQALNPERHKQHLSRLLRGERRFCEVKWRVRKGMIDGATSSGDWSEYSSFALYRTVKDRIRLTRNVRVGMTPTLLGRFCEWDDSGGVTGSDVALSKDLCARLGERLLRSLPPAQRTLTIENVYIPWDQKFDVVRSRRVDFYISQLTATHRREAEEKVSFSNGYLDVKQALIYLKGSVQPDFPKKCRIGVCDNTTNCTALLDFIDPVFEGVDVRSEYQTVGDLERAMSDGEIDGAVVDDQYVSEAGLEDTFNVVLLEQLVASDPESKAKLVDALSGYYKEAIGDGEAERQESYAIAVAHDSSELLEAINESLGELLENRAQSNNRSREK